MTVIPSNMMRLTGEGDSLLRNWKYQQDKVSRLDREIKQARLDLSKTATDLGTWILPEKQVIGEKIAVWFGDTLILACFTGSEIEVRVRQHGKTWNML